MPETGFPAFATTLDETNRLLEVIARVRQDFGFDVVGGTDIRSGMPRALAGVVP